MTNYAVPKEDIEDLIHEVEMLNELQYNLNSLSYDSIKESLFNSVHNMKKILTKKKFKKVEYLSLINSPARLYEDGSWSYITPKRSTVEPPAIRVDKSTSASVIYAQVRDKDSATDFIKAYFGEMSHDT